MLLFSLVLIFRVIGCTKAVKMEEKRMGREEHHEQRFNSICRHVMLWVVCLE